MVVRRESIFVRAEFIAQLAPNREEGRKIGCKSPGSS